MTTAPAKARSRAQRAESAGTSETKAQLVERLEAEINNVELLRESIAELQLAMEDTGWQRLVAAGEREFTREGLRSITAACQLFSIKNPLIKRGLTLRTVYVWGQGFEITARANGKRHAGEQDVNAVIQRFLDDPGNRRVLFGADAQQRYERALGTDGNVFISLWTRPSTGRVQVRLLPWDEITDVITNPEDASEPWFYRRAWIRQEIDPASGVPKAESKVTLYPAVGYRPRSRPQTIAGVEVRWDAPVRHVKVNDLQGWKFGVADAYAAVDWARAYKEFLEDWARLVKSLSRYAWRTTAKGAVQAAAIRAKVAAAPTRNPATGEPTAVGATAVTAPDATLEAIPKTGATIDSESGKPLAAQVAAALGVPLTMLLADPGQTGARATAETLDQPTELEMESRRHLHTDVLRDLCEYVIREAVRAPKGTLKGTVGTDEDDPARETVALAGDTDLTVDIVWPDLKDLDPAGMVEAIVKASATQTVPPQIVLRMLLTTLGQRNVDELIDALTAADGTFLWPSVAPLGTGIADVPDPGTMQPGDDPDEDGDSDG